MRVLRACLDGRVLVALAAVALGVFLLAPQLTGTVLPLLVAAACPLSMVVMLRTISRARPEPAAGSPQLARLRQAATTGTLSGDEELAGR